MESQGLHRFALVVAVLTLIVVSIGAYLTTVHEQQRAGQRTEVPSSFWHETVAGITGLLLIGLAISVASGRPENKTAVYGTAGLFVVDGILGLQGVRAAAPELAGQAHAILAAVTFSGTAVLALVTSPGWNREPEFVKDGGWPSMRSMGKVTPVLILIQIALGAAFRHGALGILPHLAGAMLIALLILLMCVFVLQQFPKHALLKNGAILLGVVGSVQVALGFMAFVLRMIDDAGAAVILTSSVAHVATGSLTLASSVVLATIIRRDVQPKPEG